MDQRTGQSKHPGVFLISGLPGVGKSTIARYLATRFERSAHIESDVVQAFMISGRVAPSGQPAVEAAAQLELRTRNLAMLARNFLAAGFVPVVDDLVATRARFDRFRELLRPSRLHLVVLTASPSVMQERIHSREHGSPEWVRGDKPYFAAVEQRMSTELGDLGLWLDTGELTVEGAVEKIMRHVTARTMGNGLT